MNALATIRRLLLLVLVTGMAGTLVELLLLSHVEEWQQLIPVVLLGGALVILVMGIAMPRQAPPLVLRATMVLFLGAGAAGIVLHYLGARAFQLEVEPSLSGVALFWKSVRATAPPALAPGSMIGLGLVGLAYVECLRRTEES